MRNWQKIPDVSKRNACMAAAFGFARKYVTDAEVNELLEVMQMSELWVMLVTNAIKDVARKMLQRGMSISAIARIQGLTNPRQGGIPPCIKPLSAL